MAKYRRRKQRIKNNSQFTLVLGLLDEEHAVVSREDICSLCNVRGAAVTSSAHRLLDAVGVRLHSTVFTARYGLRAAFVWLCKPQTFEDHVLYHATVVSRCTRKYSYPQQQSFVMCCGRRRALDVRTQKFKSAFKHRPPVG